MLRISLLVLLLAILPLSLKATVFPKEGSQLNYRLVGFSLPFENGKGKYKIEIAEGSYNNIDSFERNITITTYARTNKIIGEVPSFGRQYTWRAMYIAGNSEQKKSRLYHFSTGFLPVVDSSQFRLRIIKHAEKYRDASVFVDA